MPAAVPSSATSYGQRSPPLRQLQQHTVNIPSLRTERSHHQQYQQQQQQEQQRPQVQQRQQTVERMRPASTATHEISTQDDFTVQSNPSISRLNHYERQGMQSMPVRVVGGGGGGTGGGKETLLNTYERGSSVKSAELPTQIQRQQALYATIGRETSS